MNTRFSSNLKAVIIALFATSLSLPAHSQVLSTTIPAKPPLFAHLLGGNEVSPAGKANSGDPNGTGSATVITKGVSELCFAILTKGIGTPTAAHIHKALAGLNGPIVVTLTAPIKGNPGASSGCINNLPIALVLNIRTNPSEYYINVHTERFPAGAIRGQLF